MSMLYSIDIKLYAQCNEDNIWKILERGSEKGFTYDDIGEGLEYAKPLDAKTAARKIIESYTNKPDLGPSISVNLELETSAALYFYKIDNNYLEFHMADISCPKKKGHFIDFDYYIRLCLDLVVDFPILEVKTEMI